MTIYFSLHQHITLRLTCNFKLLVLQSLLPLPVSQVLSGRLICEYHSLVPIWGSHWWLQCGRNSPIFFGMNTFLMTHFFHASKYMYHVFPMCFLTEEIVFKKFIICNWEKNMFLNLACLAQFSNSLISILYNFTLFALILKEPNLNQSTLVIIMEHGMHQSFRP